MKKIILLISALMLVLLFTVPATAAENIHPLGEMSFYVPPAFEKTVTENETLFFKNTSNPPESISFYYDKNSLLGTGVSTVNDITDDSLEAYIKEIFTSQFIADMITDVTGEIPSLTIGASNCQKLTTAAGVSVFCYSVCYNAAWGSAHLNDAVFSSAMVIDGADMYLISYNQASANTKVFSDIIESLRFVWSDSTLPQAPPSEDAIKIIVDGERIYPDNDPIIVDSRTLCPIRAVAEKLGYTLTWNDDTKTASVSRDETSLRVKIGEFQIEKSITKSGEDENGMGLSIHVAGKKETITVHFEKETIPIDVAARIINNRTYLPLRAIGESLGCDVSWQAETKTVYINSK